MVEFAHKAIGFTVVKVNDDCNLMLSVMQTSYAAAKTDSKFQITDLAKVCESKDKAAVTSHFVKATSFILAAALGKGSKKREPLWDVK